MGKDKDHQDPQKGYQHGLLGVILVAQCVAIIFLVALVAQDVNKEQDQLNRINDIMENQQMVKDLIMNLSMVVKKSDEQLMSLEEKFALLSMMSSEKKNSQNAVMQEINYKLENLRISYEKLAQCEATTQCLETWAPYSGKCYLIQACNNSTCSRDAAQADCTRHNGTLATITSGRHNKFIRHLLPEHAIWIGAGKNDASVWVWMDGIPLNQTYMNWAIGEPAVGDNCAMIGGATDLDGAWISSDCVRAPEDPTGYVCESRAMNKTVMESQE